MLAPPKTDRGRSRIRLSEIAVEALRKQRVRQNEQRLNMGPYWHTANDFVFTDEIGRPLRGNLILQREFQPLCRKAGLPIIRLHDLRHTAASLLGAEGIPVVAVSQMLGHSSVAMTLDIYSHAFPDAQKDAAAAFDRVLSPRRKRTAAENQDTNAM